MATLQSAHRAASRFLRAPTSPREGAGPEDRSQPPTSHSACNHPTTLCRMMGDRREEGGQGSCHLLPCTWRLLSNAQHPPSPTPAASSSIQRPCPCSRPPHPAPPRGPAGPPETGNRGCWVRAQPGGTTPPAAAWASEKRLSQPRVGCGAASLWGWSVGSTGPRAGPCVGVRPHGPGPGLGGWVAAGWEKPPEPTES